jgi:pimeloyl-ACP methyl ester carboxylesterase
MASTKNRPKSPPRKTVLPEDGHIERPLLEARPSCTLLFLHGLRGDSHGLRFIADPLKADYTVLNLDLPGSGKTPELTPQTLETHIGYLHKIIKTLPEPPVIIAHSMGTIIASHYLKTHPKSVKKAVLISPIFRAGLKSALNPTFYYLLSGLLRLLPPKPRTRLLRSKTVSLTISHFLTSDRTKQAMIDYEHLAYSANFASATSLLADIKISMTEQTLVPNLETLFIIGAKDQLTPVKLAKNRVPTITVIKHTGHLLNYETPQTLTNLIKDFLRN